MSTCFWDVHVGLDLVNVVPSGWAASISEKWWVLRHVVVHLAF